MILQKYEITNKNKNESQKKNIGLLYVKDYVVWFQMQTTESLLFFSLPMRYRKVFLETICLLAMYLKRHKLRCFVLMRFCDLFDVRKSKDRISIALFLYDEC